MLHRLRDDATWEAIERALWGATVAVYQLEPTGIRLDSTTSYGYHQATNEGVMQLGHSKDHRPDLPQLQLMAVAAEPSGHLIACDVHPSQCADVRLEDGSDQRPNAAPDPGVAAVDPAGNPGAAGAGADPGSFPGLYEGSPTRTTERPTGTRILKAFACA